MKARAAIIAVAAIVSLAASAQGQTSAPPAAAPAAGELKDWMIGPFVKQDDVNPILGPNFDPQFFCPVRRKFVRWESRAIIGGGAVVRNGRVYMVYNAEDSSEGFQRKTEASPGTMRMGLAVSEDGLRFTRRTEPVLYPDTDFMQKLEWPGGPQIPRLVEGPNRKYYLHYSPWDLRVSRIATATSTDLVHWTKHGNIFEKTHGGKYRDLWAKSGAVVCSIEKGRLVAARISGRYWMYWGEGCFWRTQPTSSTGPSSRMRRRTSRCRFLPPGREISITS